MCMFSVDIDLVYDSMWCMHERIRGRKTFTNTPSIVLAINKYKKLPKKCKAIEGSILLRSKLWIALKSTTDVASFTTPSPNTRLYSKGVSSWFSTCIIIHKFSNYKGYLSCRKNVKNILLQTCNVQTESVAANIAPIAGNYHKLVSQKPNERLPSRWYWQAKYLSNPLIPVDQYPTS